MVTNADLQEKCSSKFLSRCHASWHHVAFWCHDLFTSAFYLFFKYLTIVITHEQLIIFKVQRVLNWLHIFCRLLNLDCVLIIIKLYQFVFGPQNSVAIYPVMQNNNNWLFCRIIKGYCELVVISCFSSKWSGRNDTIMCTFVFN